MIKNKQKPSKSQDDSGMIPGRNGGKLKPQRAGEPSHNPNGRPRKFVTSLKDAGYKNSEISDVLKSILVLNHEEVSELSKNPKATILERTIARAMLEDSRNSRAFTLQDIMNRLVGKMTSVDLTSDGEKIEQNTIIVLPDNGRQ